MLRGSGALAACLLVSGCASGLSAGSVARATLPRDRACRCDRVEHFELGRFTLALVRMVLGSVDGVEADDRAIVAGLRHLEMAEYRLEGCEGGAGEALDRLLTGRGWVDLVATRERGTSTRVVVRQDREGRTRGLLVVERDGTSLEVVVVEGDLDPVLRQAFEEDPDGAVSRVLAAAG